MKNKNWTAKQIAQTLKMPLRQIQFYSEQQGLLPGLNQNVGRGKPREYTRKHLVGLIVIRELARLGMTISKLRDVVFQFYQLQDKWWDDENERFTDEPFYILVYNSPEGEGFTFGHRSHGDKVTVAMQRHSSVIVINVGLLVTHFFN